MSKYQINTFKTGELKPHEYQRIVAGIRNMYIWFAPGSTDEAIYKRLHQHPETRISILVDENKGGSIVGFSVYQSETFNGSRVMFRGGTIVQERSKGHYKRLLEHSITLEDPDFLVAMTQNPRVYETLRSFTVTGRIYPTVTGDVPPENVRCIANHFCKAPNLDPETLVVPNIYGTIRKEDSFKTVNDSDVQLMFESHLKENDGFMIVASLK